MAGPDDGIVPRAPDQDGASLPAPTIGLRVPGASGALPVLAAVPPRHGVASPSANRLAASARQRAALDNSRRLLVLDGGAPGGISRRYDCCQPAARWRPGVLTLEKSKQP